VTRAARFAALAIAVPAVSPGCDRGAPGTAAPSASVSAPPPHASARRASTAPLAHERVAVPGGAFHAGSVPGEPGRKPELEPRTFSIELGPFQIDKLPWPSEPGQPPRTGVSRSEAERLCAERAARLCTELEWERACKGPAGDTFPGAASWDPSCADPKQTCASGFDVLGLGGLREWTASDVVPADSEQPRRAAVRGSPAAAAAHEHRCARRRGIDPDTRADDLGFRCCKGAPNAAVVPEPRLGSTFRQAKIEAARLEKLLAAHPRTAPLARDVKFFREPDATNTVLGRGEGDKQGFSFSAAPLLWNPVAGAEYLLVAARSGKDTSFVAAFHVLGDDDYRLAASFVMKGEPGPVAFAYSGYIRPRLHFSTCWGCPGETGKILHRDPDSVAILQP
jgi:hypothetical protein